MLAADTGPTAIQDRGGGRSRRRTKNVLITHLESGPFSHGTDCRPRWPAIEMVVEHPEVHSGRVVTWSPRSCAASAMLSPDRAVAAADPRRPPRRTTCSIQATTSSRSSVMRNSLDLERRDHVVIEHGRTTSSRPVASSTRGPHRITGKWSILPVWTSTSDSNSSSNVP